MIPEPCFRLQCKHPSPPSLDQGDRPLSSPLMLAGSCSRHRRRRFYPGVGKIPGGGNGNPHQYSCLENPMDRGAWQATVHGATRVGHDFVTKPPHGKGCSVTKPSYEVRPHQPHVRLPVASRSQQRLVLLGTLDSVPSDRCSGISLV